MKFVVRKAKLSHVFPCQHPSSRTRYVCTKIDPAARRLTPSGRSTYLVWSTFVAAEPPVIHWKHEGHENDIEQFGSVEARAGSAVVWILHGRFWVGHDRLTISTAANNLAVSVSLGRQYNDIRETPRSRDCCV